MRGLLFCDDGGRRWKDEQHAQALSERVPELAFRGDSQKQRSRPLPPFLLLHPSLVIVSAAERGK